MERVGGVGGRQGQRQRQRHAAGSLQLRGGSGAGRVGVTERGGGGGGAGARGVDDHVPLDRDLAGLCRRRRRRPQGGPGGGGCGAAKYPAAAAAGGSGGRGSRGAGGPRREGAGEGAGSVGFGRVDVRNAVGGDVHAVEEALHLDLSGFDCAIAVAMSHRYRPKKYHYHH